MHSSKNLQGFFTLWCCHQLGKNLEEAYLLEITLPHSIYLEGVYLNGLHRFLIGGRI